MTHIITGIFSDTKVAGECVSELRTKDYIKDISLVAKDDMNGEVTTQSVKEDGAEGATTGATVGAAVAGGATLLAGITAVAIPGVGLVAGALATALAAASTGAVTGGVVGYLVDKGIPDNTASEYKVRIESGQVLIAIEVEVDYEHEVEALLYTYGATDVAHTE